MTYGKQIVDASGVILLLLDIPASWSLLMVRINKTRVFWLETFIELQKNWKIEYNDLIKIATFALGCVN